MDAGYGVAERYFAWLHADNCPSFGQGRAAEYRQGSAPYHAAGNSVFTAAAGCGRAVFRQAAGKLWLEPQVHYIAKMYIAAIGVGVLPFFLSTALRALVDTSGYTGITMKIYLLALPVNAFLNYCLIFGKFGAPALGGIGAGLATGITYWLEFFIFVWVVHKLPAFAPLRIFTDKFKFDMAQLRENLSLGVPMGMAIFMEASIFGVIAVFIAKFGTIIIAAHQAAMSFTSLLYMVPLSFSMSLTIVVGVEAGARRFGEALRYSLLGIACNITVAVLLTIFVLFDREFIAGCILRSL